MEQKRIISNYIPDEVSRSKIYKGVIQPNRKEKSDFKMEKGPEQTVLKRTYTNSQQVNEEVLNFTINQQMQIKNTM